MPSKARVTVEIDTDEDGTPCAVELFLNTAGLKLLIHELSALTEEHDHFHWFSPEWSNPDGELSQIAYNPEHQTAHHFKVLYRPDHWDRKHFPHLFSGDDAD